MSRTVRTTAHALGAWVLLLFVAALMGLGIFSALREQDFREQCRQRGGIPHIKGGDQLCLRAETIAIPGFK